MARRFICKKCYSSDVAEKSKGSSAVEILVWIVGLVATCFTMGISIILPIFYTMWKMLSKYKVCGKCNSTQLVPVNSRAGKHLLQLINVTQQMNTIAKEESKSKAG